MLERAAPQPEEITNTANVKERCIHGLYEAGARWEAGGGNGPPVWVSFYFFVFRADDQKSFKRIHISVWIIFVNVHHS